MKHTAGLLILLAGCGSPTFHQLDSKPPEPLEETVSKGLEIFAKSSTNCRDEKLALVRKDKMMIQNLVAQTKNLATTNTATLSIKSQSSQEQLEMILQILTSDGFKVVVSQTSDLIKTVANNEIIMSSLTAIRDDLLAEPGDRIAEIIISLASDTSKQSALLGAVRSALCDNPSEEDLVGVLLTPQVLWQLGPNATYLLAGPLAKHTQPLLLALKQIPIQDELQQFAALVKDMLPKQDICAIDNLDPYQKHLALVLSLLKTGDSLEPRPLRNFVNVLFRLYSMDVSNQCSGISFDELQKETIQNAFITVANFLADDQHGVVAFLKQMKPRK